MQTVSHSAFLQALGYAIANSLWQMALVYMIYVLLNSLLKFSSATKYKVAVTAQLIGFAWFAITLQFYFVQCNQALKDAAAFNNYHSFIVPQVGTTLQSYLLNFMVKGEKILPYLSTAYLLLLVFLSARLLGSYQHTQQIRKQGLQKADIDIRIFVTKVAAQLGIKQKVKVYLSNLVSSPLTIGFLKPIVLIPLASINQLSTQQLEAVLLHELAHIKRFDYLLNIVLSVLELMLFFNPFTQLLSKNIKRERENSCDDWVLQFQYNPTLYAEALLHIAYLQLSPALAMNSVKNKSDLLPRVKRMIEAKEKPFNYKLQLLTLLLVTFFISSLAWLSPIIGGKNKAMVAKSSTHNTQSLIIEPIATKVNNPFFNPVFFLNKPLKKEMTLSLELTKQQMANHQTYAETATNETITTTLAQASENLEENIDRKQIDVGADLKTININEVVLTKLNSDSAFIKNGFTISLNQNLDKEWKKINEDVKKTEIDVRKVFKEIKQQDFEKRILNTLKLVATNNKETTNKQLYKERLLKVKLKLDSIVKPLNTIPPNYVYGYPMPTEAIGYSFANNIVVNDYKELAEIVTIKLNGNKTLTDSTKKEIVLIFEHNKSNIKVIIENVQEPEPQRRHLKRAVL